MHGQSKRASVIESILNMLIGLVINFTAQLIIFPCFDIYVSFGEHLGISAFFTLVSLTRSYFLRRFFNWLHYKRELLV